MKTIQAELEEIIADMRTYPSAVLTDLAEKLDQVSKRLAAGFEPVKVLIAVYDHTVEVMASTASAKVVSVDHRSQAGQRLQVGMAPVLAVPAEFIEHVSDEAAEYLSDNADQLSVLSTL